MPRVANRAYDVAMPEPQRKSAANGRVVLAGFGALMIAIAIALLVWMPHVLPVGVVVVFGLPGLGLIWLALRVRSRANPR